MSWKQELELDMAQIKLGHRPAFEALYRRTSGKLYGLLMKLLNDPEMAADVLQESYTKIWLNSSQYQTTLGDPWPWICQLTRHCALDKIRQQKRRFIEVADIELDSLLSEQVSPWEGGYDLHNCLAKVRKEPRQAIVLAYFYGLSHSELAHRMQQPLGTLKSWIRRGLKELELCLKD